jgi:ATP-dependent helicase/DNAse subunit B
MQRILPRRILAELVRQQRLPHFGNISGDVRASSIWSAFISELKRSETWPEHFDEACVKRGNRPRDRELGLIYTRYQQALVAGGLYDGEGRFWSAREALADGHWGRFADLSLVVVDGFTDFTEAQYRIVELLARKAERVARSEHHKPSFRSVRHVESRER